MSLLADLAPPPPTDGGPGSMIAVGVGVILLGAALAAGVLWFIAKLKRSPRDAQSASHQKTEG